MSEQSFFRTLLHRRVPHIVGLYIGAMWLAIEIGDWLIERFFLPPQITGYVFIAMISLLPAVVNHGVVPRSAWQGPVDPGRKGGVGD